MDAQTNPFVAASSDEHQLRACLLPLADSRILPFIAAHPHSTVYHHPAWLQTLCAEYEREIALLGCETADGTLVGMLPLLRTRGLGLPVGGLATKSRLASLPRTPIAGPLSTSHAAARRLIQAALERAAEERGMLLQFKTEGAVLDGVVEGVLGAPWRQSFILPLSEDPAELRIGSSGTHRSRIRWAVRKAQRMGLRVRFTDSDEDLRRWYAMYLDNMRRVAIPPRPLRLFVAMHRLLAPLGLMKLMIAERDTTNGQELIAGSIFLMYGRRVFYAFTACPTEHYTLRPHDLIQWEAIHWSAANGFREYDLGETPADNVQLAAFKAKWGAEERTLYRYYYPSSPRQRPAWTPPIATAVAGRIWRQVPLSATALIGDLLYSRL